MRDEIFEFEEQLDFTEFICQILIKKANEEIESKGKFTLLLSGGKTPKWIYSLLSEKYITSLNWARVHFFWVDERCVNPNHVESNYGQAMQLFLSNLSQYGSINYIDGSLSPEISASNYIDRLNEFFGIERVQFDFAILGMGDDGHVASIFPEEIDFQKDRLVRSSKSAFGNYFRVTLSEELINRTKTKLLMVTSDHRWNIVQSNQMTYPINRIRNKIIVRKTR
jgi:6-phosphogluconolactonase